MLVLHFIIQKMVETEISIPYTGNGDFILNSTSLEIIHTTTGKYVYSVSGGNVPNDDKNNVYDFTNWVSRHPGGSSKIQKWKLEDYNMKYPNSHSTSRWNAHVNSHCQIFGKLGETINFNTLKQVLDLEMANSIIHALFPQETTTQYIPSDVGLEPDRILSHLQTRNTDLNWQTYFSTVREYQIL